MLNTAILVGKIAKLENNELVIATTRSYKNEEGQYETDLINCNIYNGIAQNVNDWCKIGDTVGIKGRIETRDNKICITVDKISFLSSKKKEEE